jgi:hypothetical protein
LCQDRVWMSGDQALQAILHFPQALEHLDPCQTEGRASLQGQQITDAPAQVLAEGFALLLWGLQGVQGWLQAVAKAPGL